MDLLWVRYNCAKILKPYSPAHHPQKTNVNRRRYRIQGLTHLLDGKGRHMWIIDKPWKLAAQALFTDRHKQDFSLLAPTSDHKVKKISRLLPQIPFTSTPNFQGTSFFSSSWKILMRTFPSLVAHLVLINLFVLLVQDHST